MKNVANLTQYYLILLFFCNHPSGGDLQTETTDLFGERHYFQELIAA